MIRFLVEHWEYVVLAIYLAEKIVKVTPTKYDDIVVDIIAKTILQIVRPVDEVADEIEKDIESREG